MTVRNILHWFFSFPQALAMRRRPRETRAFVQNSNRILHRGFGGISLPQQAATGAQNQMKFDFVRTVALLATLAKTAKKPKPSNGTAVAF